MVDARQQIIQHRFGHRRVAAVACELLLVALKFFQDVRFQIGAATHLHNLKQGGECKVVVNLGGAQQQLFEPTQQVLQSQISADTLVEWVFVKNHGLHWPAGGGNSGNDNR